MSLVEFGLLLLAGFAAGTVNTIVGSGSLITFPTLLAFGYPPLLANVTNNVGVLPASFTALPVSRPELRGQGRRLALLIPASVLGAISGAVLLLQLPSTVFDAVVPVLILLACLLVGVQPAVNAWLRRRGRARGTSVGPALWIAVALTGVYGGYFGAAQGVILVALAGILIDEPLPRLNAAKNVLAGMANLAAAVVFVLVSDVAWLAALAIALGSAAGGLVGPRIGRALPPVVYRTGIVVVGVSAAVALLVN